MLLIWWTGLVTLIFFAYLYLKYSYKQRKVHLPGQKPQFLLGNLLNSGILTGKRTLQEVLLYYQQQYGDKFVFWFGLHPCLTFCTAEHAQKIFSDQQTFDQSALFLPNSDLILPYNLLTLPNATWKRHIRVMLPMFKRTKILHHTDIVIELTDRFIDRHFRKNEIHRNLLDYTRSLTMNIFGWIAFDYDFDDDKNSAVKQALIDFVSCSTTVVMLPWIPRWLLRFYLKVNWRYQQAHQLIRQSIKNIVEQEQTKQYESEHQRPTNFIASLVSSLNEQANDKHASSSLTRAEVFDEVLFSFIAGYEVTSTALTWFIYYMSKYPHIQQRMKDELREQNLLEADDSQCLSTLTYETVESLRYCDCVVKELLRMAPVAGLTTRMALRDTVIDDVPIRRGETIFIALNNIHHDKRYWKYGNPDEFFPERFLSEDKSHHLYAWLPFGGGHRACMGQDLAWFELKLIIIRLMQRNVVFEDTPANTGGYEEQIACYPKKLAVNVRMN